MKLKKPSRKIVITTAFGMALAIFAVVGLLAYHNMRDVRASDYWQNHTHVVIQQLDVLMGALSDAETGQRGFIITNNDGYLEPYHRALGRIAEARANLRMLTRDNRSQQQRLAALDPLIDQKLAQLRDVANARRIKGFDVASDMVMTHLGKNIMDSIRVLVTQAEEEENHLLQERTATMERDMAKTVRALEAGGVIGFAILLMVYSLLNAEVAQRAKAQEELTGRNEELQRTRERESAQSWIKTGVNDLNTRVRGDRELAAMAADTIDYICSYVNARVGAIYLAEEETLRIVANYAFTEGLNVNRTLALGQGIAGQAARARRLVSVRDIPPELMIKSVMGEVKPRLILALPLLHDSTLVGAVELGALHDFTAVELEFLNQAAEALGIAISVNLTRQQVNELLLQSQAQEEELRVQQEELQQSNEELEERAELLEQQREQIQVKNREMEAVGREILQKARELEQVSTYKSEFLANMSHELRTPLNSLMILSGYLQENREGNLTPKQVEYAATIKSAGVELLNLINDILDLSKVEAGRIEFVYEDAGVDQLCEQLMATLKPQAGQKGLSLSMAIEEGVPQKITLDPHRTLQVLKNLLSNAVKFTNEGGVSLRVYSANGSTNPLGVPAVAFEVADTGIGIAPEKRELIFQAFQQADGSTSRKYGGTGLGLSISRQLARAMHGEVVAGAGEGRGSVFTLYLPLAGQPAQASGETVATAPRQAMAKGPQPVAEGAAPAPTALGGPMQDDREGLSPGARSILIIEDDPTFARLLMDRVREREFAAIVAADGPSGLALADCYLPTAILLDVMLQQGMDGWAVMQKLTDNPRTRHIPVHFISALEEKQKALSMGAIGFVTKPITSEQLDRVFSSIEAAVARTLKRLLIVEDDKAQAAALVALLQERDIPITVAESGARAIELLSSGEFDCIVLDLGLADMSGFDLLEHVRSLDETKRVPIIIHTGRELSREETQRLQQYAESIIIKGAKSPERLLNEVTLFLHVMESRLPPDKQRMIRTTLENEEILNGKKVLLVDDDMRNIFSLSSVLADKGMEIVEAENGKAALARLEEHPDIDIVLMDVMMPEMDGYEATRRIRQDPRFARLPIIALTAKAMKGDREACLKAGASDYLTKPVDLERLVSLLRVWLYNQE
jgi:CheY-like chemotaxis protein